jgi:hypothetical protein
VRSLPVVDLEVDIQGGLYLLDRLVPLGPSRDTDMLSHQRSVEALDEPVRVRLTRVARCSISSRCGK